MAKYLCEEDMNTGEYISRDKILKAIHSYCENCDNYNGAMCRACNNADVMDMIIDMPVADVKHVKRGKWSRIDYCIGHDYICSVCKCKDDRRSQFCPNCGADMRTE